MDVPDRFVSIDTEVARRRPLQICAIAVVRYEHGQEVAHARALVRVDGPVQFTRIHGLRRSDLSRAALWPEVWKKALAVMDDTTTLVAFRAQFDRAAILATSAYHGVRLPRLRFICAAEALRQRLGNRLTLAEYLALLGIEFPGEPHDPLADARAAALAFLACGFPSPNASLPDPA